MKMVLRFILVCLLAAPLACLAGQDVSDVPAAVTGGGSSGGAGSVGAPVTTRTRVVQTVRDAGSTGGAGATVTTRTKHKHRHAKSMSRTSTSGSAG